MTYGPTEAFCEFTFAAGHQLPHVPEGHPCGRVHGHTWQVRVTVSGPVDPHSGFVLDFADIYQAWAPLHEALDHRFLNDVRGLENPTTELLAQWLWERLRPALPLLAAIEVRESGSSGVLFRG